MTRFTACFGEGKSLMAAKKVWQEGLMRFSDSTLEKAAKEAIDFPAEKFFTLGEFKKICEEIRERDAPVGLPAYSRNSDMTHSQWKSWVRNRFGVEVSILSPIRRNA